MGKKDMRPFGHITHDGYSLKDDEFWFIHYYIQLHDKNKAAKKIDISPQRASNILKKDYVVAEINYLEGNITQKADIDTMRLYKELWQIGTGVQKDPFGFDIAPADRIKALTELLKRTDDMKDKEKLLKDNAVKITITREYSTISKNDVSAESEEKQ